MDYELQSNNTIHNVFQQNLDEANQVAENHNKIVEHLTHTLDSIIEQDDKTLLSQHLDELHSAEEARTNALRSAAQKLTALLLAENSTHNIQQPHNKSHYNEVKPTKDELTEQQRKSRHALEKFPKRHISTQSSDTTSRPPKTRRSKILSEISDEEFYKDIPIPKAIPNTRNIRLKVSQIELEDIEGIPIVKESFGKDTLLEDNPQDIIEYLTGNIELASVKPFTRKQLQTAWQIINDMQVKPNDWEKRFVYIQLGTEKN
ncbi:MAG: hypothetical protein NVSMB46_08000 [Candidatus Saccharimonadales bacterium]